VSFNLMVLIVTGPLSYLMYTREIIYLWTDTPNLIFRTMCGGDDMGSREHIMRINSSSIKRTVFLEFIHRLVSQEQTKLKI
jgi:hypothetical protein